MILCIGENIENKSNQKVITILNLRDAEESFS